MTTWIEVNFERNTFNTNDEKQKLIDLACKFFGPRNWYDFKPYRPNDSDWDFWTVDTGNDYKIKFESKSKISLVHRYSNEKVLNAWAVFIKFHLGEELV